MKLCDIIVSIYENPKTGTNFKTENLQTFLKYISFSFNESGALNRTKFLSRIALDTENISADSEFWIEALRCNLKSIK